MEIARLTFTRREADDDLDRQRQSGGRTSHDSFSFVNGVVWMRRVGGIFIHPNHLSATSYPWERIMLLCYPIPPTLPTYLHVPPSRRRRSRVGLLFRVRIYTGWITYSVLYGLYLLYLGTWYCTGGRYRRCLASAEPSISLSLRVVRTAEASSRWTPGHTQEYLTYVQRRACTSDHSGI